MVVLGYRCLHSMCRIIGTVFIVCVFASLFGCSGLSNIEQPQSPDAEIYEVYSAALEDIFKDLPQDRVLYVSDRIAEKGSPSVGLERKFSFSFRYELIDKSMMETDSATQDGEAFKAKYPGFIGLVTLSPIDFDDLHDEATVGVDFTGCPLCGFGETVVLQKEESQGWKVVSRETGWQS